MKSLDLDTDTPDKIPAVLRNAAEQFHKSMSELQSAWGDQNAGKVWGDIANIMERAACSIERAIAKRGL